ncbi:NCA Localization Factor [Ditylenchus destructor]|uniref:NCA Localization Factor n=1 Tax=Ditylenchus destructor TaxID=166010 RepID=A0AAD4MYX9_9BILA|nr:NCA Localization Factor [Ditylenchus destructor]
MGMQILSFSRMGWMEDFFAAGSSRPPSPFHPTHICMCGESRKEWVFQVEDVLFRERLAPAPKSHYYPRVGRPSVGQVNSPRSRLLIGAAGNPATRLGPGGYRGACRGRPDPRISLATFRKYTESPHQFVPLHQQVYGLNDLAYFERDPRFTTCLCDLCVRRKYRLGKRGHQKQQRWSRSGRNNSHLHYYLAIGHLLCVFIFGCSIICSAASSNSNSLPITTENPEFQLTQTFHYEPVISVENFDEESPPLASSLFHNPLLRHKRQAAAQGQNNMCHIWNAQSPVDLCSRGRWARLRLMRELSLFSRDCASAHSNVQLGELFRLEWRAIKSEGDLLSHTEQLKPEGRGCVTGPARSDQCLTCFQRMEQSLTQVERAYRAFDRTLERFDCMLAVDSNSATRPFSPNGTCLDCKTWYRKWLLVQLVDIWQEPPCINWCYYTQLACPHLATSKVVDFAGHPAFQCRDLHIPQSKTGNKERKDGVSTCNCIHPCDLHRIPAPDRRNTGEPLKWQSGHQHLPGQPYDFFADAEHCWTRQMQCAKELSAKWDFSEHAAYPTGATHAQAARFGREAHDANVIMPEERRPKDATEDESSWEKQEIDITDRNRAINSHDQRRRHRHDPGGESVENEFAMDEIKQRPTQNKAQQLEFKKFRRRAHAQWSAASYSYPVAHTLLLAFMLLIAFLSI